jgi:hypothetical protein
MGDDLFFQRDILSANKIPPNRYLKYGVYIDKVDRSSQEFRGNRRIQADAMDEIVAWLTNAGAWLAGKEINLVFCPRACSQDYQPLRLFQVGVDGFEEILGQQHAVKGTPGSILCRGSESHSEDYEDRERL